MEINADKTKLMTHNTSGINIEIRVKGQTLETSTSFKYLGSVVSDKGFRDTLKDSTEDSSIDKAETSLERQEYFSHFQDMTDALPCHIQSSVCL